ncbi:MAG: DUF1282 domain-containing protein [Verrucomicrobia bacterium]|nr:MAG: DUF1282 domain-containing protein [Verrucomicrobiota bacterium]
MISALRILIEPQAVWTRLARARPGLLRTALGLLVPLLMLTAALEGWSLMRWGHPRGTEETHIYKFTLAQAVGFELIQVALAVVIIGLASVLVRSFARSIQGRQTFSEAFTLVTYGLSPLLLAQTLDAFPVIHPWVAWGVGIVLVGRALYDGVPQVLLPDPPNAFGLYLMTLLLLATTTGLARFFTTLYLDGELPRLEQTVTELIARVLP